MKEGFVKQDDATTRTCTKRTYPTKTELIYNLRCHSYALKDSAFISFDICVDKHFNSSSILNVGFQQEYLNDSDVALNESLGTLRYQIGTSMIYENNYGSPTGRVLLYFVSEHPQFDLMEILWNQFEAAVSFSDGEVCSFKKS